MSYLNISLMVPSNGIKKSKIYFSCVAHHGSVRPNQSSNRQVCGALSALKFLGTGPISAAALTNAAEEVSTYTLCAHLRRVLNHS